MTLIPEWQKVVDIGKDDYTSRLKVDGGYLYHRWDIFADSITSCMCFVPDIDLQRYQSHLRDAYKKGYQDGHADAYNGISARTIE